jgi:tRNA(Ile)-lysidine synthase TilS/MesJ
MCYSWCGVPRASILYEAVAFIAWTVVAFAHSKDNNLKIIFFKKWKKLKKEYTRLKRIMPGVYF